MIVFFFFLLIRLAVNHNNFLQQLGVKDSITRQRICVKAMDVVLFGPPRGEELEQKWVLKVLVRSFFASQSSRYIEQDQRRDSYNAVGHCGYCLLPGVQAISVGSRGFEQNVQTYGGVVEGGANLT